MALHLGFPHLANVQRSSMTRSECFGGSVCFGSTPTNNWRLTSFVRLIFPVHEDSQYMHARLTGPCAWGASQSLCKANLKLASKSDALNAFHKNKLSRNATVS